VAQRKDPIRLIRYDDDRHLGFRFSAIISVSINIFFGAKFGTVMENRQPKGSQCSEIWFLKIQDGGQPLSWISILAHNSASSNNRKAQHKATYCSESSYRNSKITDGRHLEFQESYYNSVVYWDICLKFCMMVDSDSGKSAVCILLKQQILYRKNCKQCI